MGSEVAVKRAMSAREFLATPQGAVLRRQASGRFLGQIGTVLDLVDLVRSIAGGGPGMDLEDILNNHQELLEQILKQQGDIFEGIGGINDGLQGIGGDIDQIKDLIGQIADGNDEAKMMLQSILAQQQKMAREINQKLVAISNQVTGLWSDMNSWFTVTLGALVGLADTVAEIQQQLAVIEELLREVLAELAELHDRVDWNSVISMFADHEHRVGYCVESMMDITVLPADPSAESDGPLLQVDTGELATWAASVTDEVNGLAYSLYCLHRVIVGDTLLGKPLMEVFCRLMKHKTDLGYAEAARYFLKLASVQARGFAALTKARQAANLPDVDYADVLEERLIAQTYTVNEALETHYGVTQWNDAVDREGWLRTRGGYGTAYTGDRPPKYFTVPNSRSLLTAMVFPLSASQPVRAHTEFHVGLSVPGTRQVDPTSMTVLTNFHDSKPYVINDFLPKKVIPDPVTNKSHHTVSYYPQSFVFDPKYVMVGVKLSCPDGALLCEPLVAEYDEESGTTSWTGSAAAGGLWKATLDETCLPTTLDLGVPGEQASWQTELWRSFPPVGYTDPAPVAVNGFRFSLHLFEGTMWIRPGLLDPTWEQRTMLPPPPPSTYIRYEPITSFS
ncbi:hypothetical protein GTW40_28025 [Streptomyces sp. SID4985]|uniref:hypothetical protein n=1 Tax=Streptomyces sp. SID4985 TaxID=2690292 RepID=UPI00136DBA54|nr:hypothetical protein [Streptomyces sp. SID4985]MYQ48831.1 hypothetical protein [Streptomyces sp. SID4985]